MNDLHERAPAHRLARLVGLLLAVAVTGFLLGRAAVYGVLFPFLPALVAGLTATSPVAAAVAALAGLVGLYRTWGLFPTLSCAASLLPVAVWPGMRRGTAPAALTALAVGAGAALAAALLAGIRGQGPEAYWLAAFQGLFTAGLAAAYRPAVRPLGGPAAALTAANRLALVTMVASAAAGLDGVEVAGISLATALGAALVAALSLEGGVGHGAAAGALFAAITSLTHGIDPGAVGTMALGGVAAGLLRGLGRVGALAGVLVGVLAGSYTSRSVDALTVLLGSSLLGAAVGVLLPAGRLSAMLGDLGLTPAPPPDQPWVAGRPDFGIQRLRALARLFSELSRAFGESGAVKQAEPPASSSTLAGDSAEDAEASALTGQELAPVVEAVAARVCQGCELQHTCWQAELHRTYRNLRDVWALAEEHGGITPGRFPDDFRRQCIHPADMAAAVSQVLDLVRLSRYWERRTAEGRALVSAQLAGVAQIMEGLAEAASASPAGTLGEPARRAAGARRGRQAVAYEVGVSRASKGGALISGDTVLHRRLGEDLLVAALSDGMGAGPRAAQESQVTVDMLQRLLEAGFPPDVTVRTINSILLLRSADEVFATLDLMLLRLDSGEADFLKTGAAPSFVRRGSRVSVVKAASLPAGILTQIEVPLTRQYLKPGDLLVMVTDGLLSDLAEQQVAEFLQRFPRQEPQLVADALLTRALEGRQGKPADDITVLAVLLTHPAETEARPATGWAAVKWSPIAPPRRQR